MSAKKTTLKPNLDKGTAEGSVPLTQQSAVEQKLDRIIELLEIISKDTDRVPKAFDWSKVVKD